MSRLCDSDTVTDETQVLLRPPHATYETVQKCTAGYDERGEVEVKPRLLTVSYSCLVIVQTWLVFGLTIGYTSPVLSDLEGNGNQSSAPLDKTSYQDLFSVLFPVGGLLGTLIAGWMVDKFGRKPSFMVCSITYAIGWLLIILTVLATGTNFRLLLFAGRFVGGIGVGIASLSAPLYLAEVSPSKTRGFFGTLPQLALSFGVFTAQVVGVFISYYWLAVVTLVVICLFTLLSTTLKETPRWLMTQNRRCEAHEVLVWLRGNQYDVDKELQEISQQLESESKTKLSFSQTIKEFKKKSVFYPVIIAIFLMVIQQFSGIAAILFNAEDVFKSAKIKSPALVSSLTIGGTHVVATFFGTLLADVAGRRILLITSTTIMCLSLTSMGTYEYLNEEPYCRPPDDSKCKSHLYPMAIASIACFTVGFSVGLGGLPWIVTAEIVPLRVRGFGVGIVTFINWAFVIVITGLFRNYEDAVHPWGAFWSFGVVCFFGVIYIALFIPETKGKSLEEIEHIFQ